MEKGPASPPASPPGTHHQVLTTRSSPPGPHHQCHTTSVSPTILTNPSNSMGGRWSRLCRLNPPAPRPTGERRRTESCLRNPAGGSCPGYASPAEATSFPTFFSSLFSPRNLSRKIVRRASPRDAPGTPKSSKVRLFAKKVVPRTQFFSLVWSIPLFQTF